MRGFVTLAVGDTKYYQLAANLLKSYKKHTDSMMPWAIYADQENEFTKLFDKVVIITKPYKSYMDKIEMLNKPVWEENIFIDADCLAYGDLNEYWDYYQKGGVRCIGKALSLDSTEGWFTLQGVGSYGNKCSFIPQMHGGIIFFSRDSLTEKIYTKAIAIASEYKNFEFKYFSEPADEPILALSIAINNCRPIQLEKEEKDKAFVFYPTVNKIKLNINKGKCKYSFNGKDWIENCRLVHWQNRNTEKPLYQREIDRLNEVNELETYIRTIGHYCSYFVTKLARILKSIIRKL